MPDIITSDHAAKYTVYPQNLQDLHLKLNTNDLLGVKPTCIEVKATSVKNEMLQASGIKKTHSHDCQPSVKTVYRAVYSG